MSSPSGTSSGLIPRSVIAGRICTCLILLSGAAFADSLFLRADVNASGRVDISDGITTFGFLFLGDPAEIGCRDAGDSNDSGIVDISDGIFTLEFLFLGGGFPPEPFAECGADPTADELGCELFPICPDALPPPAAPEVDSPTSPTSESTVTLRGTTEPNLSVMVTGGAEVAMTTADESGNFEVTVDLGLNRLNRLAVSASRDDGTTSAPRRVDVVQDSLPPILFIDVPVDGAETLAETVAVAGRVADTLSGFDGLEVTVDGIPAEVIVGIGTNGTFERRDVALAIGENTFRVEARDALGNTTAAEVTVTRIEPDPTRPLLRAVSGSGQRDRVGRVLKEPLVIEAVETDGSAFARKLVTFRVVRSDGVLSATAEGVGARTLQVRTDGDGLARAFLRLGTDAGCGNNRVSATSAGLQGEATFCCSADPGEAVQLNVSTGDGQTLEAGAPAAEPLRVWLSDSCNGIEGVPVTFRVVEGSGTVDGDTMVVVPTSRTGHAEVSWVLGPEEGEQVVEANFTGNLSGPAVFVATALARGDGATSFVGVVRDNAGQPLEGAHCEILTDSGAAGEAESDADGLFRIADVAAVGAAHLHVDGSHVHRIGGAAARDVPAGTFPSLEYSVTIVDGAVNSLGMGVTLPPLRAENERVYDGTTDVELRVAGIEGLRMFVTAGSIELPDGSRPSAESPITLSLNAVHHDDIPMAMTDGAAPPFAWTLQPHGIHFDPPAEIHYPNMSGLRPGAIANFLSFDHDTARFEIIATGQVSEDGTTIVSDPGVGLVRAGWGCNCPPYSVTGDVGSCAEGGGGGDGGGGGEKCTPTCIVEIDGPPCATVDEAVTYSALGTPGGGSFAWVGGVPMMGSTTAPNFTTRFDAAGVAEVVLVYTCPDGEGAVSEVNVQVDEPGESSCCLVEIVGPTCVAVDTEARFRAVEDPSGGDYDWDGGSPSGGSSASEYITAFSATGSTSVTLDYACDKDASAEAEHGIEVVEAALMFSSAETGDEFVRAADDSTGDLITPPERFRFLAGQGRAIKVRYCPATDPDLTYRCQVEVVSGGVPPNPAEGAFDANGEFRFVPAATAANRPEGNSARALISYRVRVRDSDGSEVAMAVVAQDLLDRVRQEYIDWTLNNPTSFQSGSVGLVNSVPPRIQVRVAPSRNVGGPGPLPVGCAGTACCRNEPGPHYLDSAGVGVVWDQGFVSLLTTIRATMMPDPVCLHSGHRSPSHNRRVGGKINSDHQWGRAADMSYNQTVSTDTAKASFHLRLLRAARAATTGQILLEQNTNQLLPSRWNPPSPNHVFTIGPPPVRTVTVQDTDGDGLPDRVLSTAPADSVSSATPLEYDGNGTSAPHFRVLDSNGDGNIDPMEPLRLNHGGGLQNMRTIFVNSTHVHAEAN